MPVCPSARISRDESCHVARQAVLSEIKQSEAPTLRRLSEQKVGDADSDPRVAMWKLVMQKTVLLDGPSKEELSVIFDKYDTNQNGMLEKDELKGILVEFATAKLKLLDEEDARVKKQIADAKRNMGRDNMMAELGECMLDMQLGMQEAQKACLRAQANGNIAQDLVDHLYQAMDKNRDESVSKEEFLDGATRTLLAEQLAAKQMEQMQKAMQAEMDAECKQM